MKRYFALLCIFILLGTTCTGCQLANPDMSAAGDQLVGLYVTTEYVDIYDWENIDIDSSGFITPDKINLGKVYGTFDSETETLTFPNISGYILLSLVREIGGEKEHYYVSDFSDMCTSIVDDSYELSGTFYYNENIVDYDYETEISDENTDNDNIEGSIIAAENENEVHAYIHPIYLTPNGKYYLAVDDSMAILNGSGELSHSYSIKEETYSNGFKTTSTDSLLSKVTVTFKSIAPSINFVFSQIGKDGMVMKEDHFTGENIPETYSIPSECDYILVTKTDSNGTVTHDTLDKADDSYEFYIERDEISCISTIMEILPAE